MGTNGKVRSFLGVWREDDTCQTLTGAAASFGCTLLFALYHGCLGLWYGSVWHGSIGGFYLLLTAIRGSILLTEKRNKVRPEAKRDLCRRWTFVISSLLLLVLDLALILPISMMVVLDTPVSMGLIPAIAMAAYTTWKTVMASIHFSRQRLRPSGNILVSELRTVNVMDALVSILTLQNTLIMVNQAKDTGNSMLPVSAISSGVIYAVIVSITAATLRQGLKQALQQPGPADLHSACTEPNEN